MECKYSKDLSGYAISLQHTIISEGITLGVQILLQTRLQLTEFWHSFPDHYGAFKMGIKLVKMNYSLYPLRYYVLAYRLTKPQSDLISLQLGDTVVIQYS